MEKATLVRYVKGLGDIYSIEKPFDEQLNILNKIGIKYPISVRDTAYLRLKGKYHLGTRTCHAPIYTKNSPTIIARVSPLVEDLEMAKKAVQAHKNNEYFIFDKDVYGKWEKIAQTDKTKRPENRRAIFLSERNDYKIHKDSDEARFLFQDTRKDYFNEFVSGGSIQSWQIDSKKVDSHDGTIINYLWFYSLVVVSVLDFGDWSLGYDGRALGVLMKASEAGSRKNLSYRQRELDRIKKIINGIKEGKLGTSKLEKVAEFLEKLKE